MFLCILQFFHIDSLLTRTGLGLAIAALLYLAYSLFRHRKTEVEQVVTEPEEQAIRRQQWNVDRLKQELGQKQTVLSNLQSEYEELCISMTEKDHLQEELDALSLAGEAIQSLSVQMQSRIGDRLKQQMSKTLSSLTNGRYLQVNMDENLRIGLHTADEYVPLEQVSRGTIEQAYFALRMAAMDVLCGEEELPVILDESFAFYDENRLKETLKWLAENRTQVLLFTCQKREEEALSEMGIPYRKLCFKNAARRESVSCGLEIKENRSYADNRMSFIIVQRISCHGKRGGVHRGEYLSVFLQETREEARRKPSTRRMSQRFFLTVRSMESSAFWHMRRTR